MSRPRRSKPTPITPALLARWPLPMPGAGGDKEERGRLLVVGGGRELPGAVVLAATAALRSGAGKLQIATTREVAPEVGVVVPEARVVALDETTSGVIAASARDRLATLVGAVDAALLGPGMEEGRSTATIVQAMARVESPARFVLDAGSITCFAGRAGEMSCLAGRAIITPHAGEAATLTGKTRESIEANPETFALELAAESGLVVVMKGGETFIASPDGRLWSNRHGNVGLAISGSGDTLAGAIAALVARGAALEQAAAWGVYLHARAGEILARRLGPLGYLPRELPTEFPSILHELSRRSSSVKRR